MPTILEDADEKLFVDPLTEPVYILPGIHQAKIAKGTGLSDAAISRILNGSRQPTISSMKKICMYLSRATGEYWGLDRLLSFIEVKPWLKQKNRRR